MPAYGDAAYWDERYNQEPSCFDWYQGYAGLEPILRRHIARHVRVLQLGVGTSQLQADMAAAGYSNVVNLDISSVAIAHMAELHKGLHQLTYRVGDARSMPEFGDCSFGAVIDKGTLDAILCSPTALADGTRMLREAHRVLAPGGSLVVVTYGEPGSRLALLQQEGMSWDVALYVLGKQPASTAPLPPSALPVPIIQGPIDAASLASLDAFQGLAGCHFAYVCTRHGGPEAALAACDGAQQH